MFLDYRVVGSMVNSSSFTKIKAYMSNAHLSIATVISLLENFTNQSNDNFSAWEMFSILYQWNIENHISDWNAPWLELDNHTLHTLDLGKYNL